MARYSGPVCRLCRREGVKLFLKGERCLSKKCEIEKRNFPPGQHGARKGKISDYGVQLREKQKVKRMYGLLEKQFRNTFKKVASLTGVTGHNLLIGLERRLDSVVYRMGFGSSRAQARQLVLHGHIEVNARRVSIPSFSCKQGDVIQVTEKSRNNAAIQASLEGSAHAAVPAWLEVNKPKMMGVFRQVPERNEIPTECNEQLIVELYSK